MDGPAEEEASANDWLVLVLVAATDRCSEQQSGDHPPDCSFIVITCIIVGVVVVLRLKTLFCSLINKYVFICTVFNPKLQQFFTASNCS